MILKRRFFCCLIALCGLLVGAALSESAQTVDWCGELVRLHVIADSDDADAQALKLEVRDAVLDAVQPLLSGCANSDDAFETLGANLGALTDAARVRAEECGYGGEVYAETGVFAFPDRDYGGVLVPAGDYRALRVVIGSGEGKNWWCVLYPSLCMDDGDGYYFAIGDWLKSLFGGDAQ